MSRIIHSNWLEMFAMKSLHYSSFKMFVFKLMAVETKANHLNDHYCRSEIYKDKPLRCMQIEWTPKFLFINSACDSMILLENK